MITYGVNAMYFYCGIVATLLVEYIVLSIVLLVLKRKTKRLKKELKDLEGMNQDEEKKTK